MKSEGVYRGGIYKIIHGVRTQPALFAMFTAYKTFIVLLFMEGFLFTGTFHVGSYTFPVLIVFILVCLGVFLFFAFRFRSISIFDKKEYLSALVALMVLGVFFVFMENHAGIANEQVRIATLILGTVMLGIGTMGIHIELARITGMLGMTPTLTFGIASAFATSVLALGISFLGETPKWIITFLLPVIIVFAFDRARDHSFPDRKELYRESAENLLIPYRFMITSLTQGLALGVPLGFLSLSGFYGPESDVAGYFFAALFTLLAVLVMQMDFNRAVYQVGFPLAGCGLLAVGVFGTGAAIAGVIQIAGFIYLDLVLWGLGSYLIKNCNQPATWVASCPSAALMTGRALGITIGCIALQSFTDPQQVSLFFCVLAFLVLLAALLLSNSTNLRTGWGFVRPGDPSANNDAYQTCQVIAQDYGLTQREPELMYSIVKGKSRKEIADDLFITPNTTKTHLHNLYGKLNIHSEKDLKAFVAKREKMFSTADAADPVAPIEL